MYPQLEQENCFTFATLAPGQTTVSVNQTIFENDDLVVYRDGVVCTLVTVATTAMQYQLVYTPGTQGISVVFGAGAAGGEDVVCERDIDARRMVMYNVAGPVPIAGLNDEQNIIAAQIQSAARWQEDGSGVIRATPGANISLIEPEPLTVIGFDADNNLTLFPIADLLAMLPPIDIANLVTQLLQILQGGDDVDIIDNGDGTITIDVDLGGDLLLLEGDQQSGAGGGGSSPSLTVEDVMDYLASTGLVAGTNISSIAYDDTAGTLTINASGGGGGLTSEQVMDTIAQMIGETSPLVAVYDDGADTYTLSVSQSGLKPPTAMIVKLCADDVALSGTMTKTIRAPFACTVSGVRAGLKTAQSSGSKATFDVTEAGVSIFGANKVTIDNGSKTSVGASVAADLNDTALADDAELVVSCVVVGDGTATGGFVTILFSRA